MKKSLTILICVFMCNAAFGGPYVLDGVSGFVDARGAGISPREDSAVLNPIFRGWAEAVADYSPAAGVDAYWLDSSKTLGPVTGDIYDVASLGDLTAAQIASDEPPGSITLQFASSDPAAVIRDGRGYDFAVFENGFSGEGSVTDMGFAQGKVFAELAYVEVSSDGDPNHFVRFPAVSRTSEPVGGYGTIESSDVFNLAGRHPNGGGQCRATMFDLAELADQPLVLDGTVDLQNIRFVRIVDIPGSGDFHDDAAEYIDPQTYDPNDASWGSYDSDGPIYDAWYTFGSGGFDLEAIGVLHEQQFSADINLDGVVDNTDWAILARAIGTRFGDEGYRMRCDLDGNLVIDTADAAVFCSQWLQRESWTLRP